MAGWMKGWDCCKRVIFCFGLVILILCKRNLYVIFLRVWFCFMLIGWGRFYNYWKRVLVYRKNWEILSGYLFIIMCWVMLLCLIRGVVIMVVIFWVGIIMYIGVI